MDDYKQGQNLDKYKDENKGKDIGYVPLPFITLPPPQQESNHPTDMDKGTRSLNHLLCIRIIGLSYNC